MSRPKPHPPAWQSELERLAIEDFVSIPHWIDESTRSRWQTYAAELYHAGLFRNARIGRLAEQCEQRNVRGDQICWLPENRAESVEIMHWLQTIAEFLNRRFMLGLVDFETHFARYETGSHYQRHIDNGRNTNRRVISLIVYLNSEWRPEWGGQLLIHDQSLTHIDPEPGRGVVFLSHQLEHEVLTTTMPRWSLTCWFLGRDSKAI